MVIVTDEEQGIFLEHWHYNLEKLAHIHTFGNRISDFTLRHRTGTA